MATINTGDLATQTAQIADMRAWTRGAARSMFGAALSSPLGQEFPATTALCPARVVC